MKKNLKLKIASLALGATSCLALGVATLNRADKTANAETSTQVGTMYTLTDFKIDETAAIREDEPMGIRFTTEIRADVKTQIINKLGGDASKVVFGTLILPTDMLGDAELTHNTPSVVEGQVSQWLNDTTYTVVLGGKGGADLGESYYNRPISARSFAYNTETKEVCYTSNTANRSIGYVAYMAVNDENGSDSDIVEGIEQKTKKELVFNENVSIHNEDASGSVVINNKYDKQSSDVFVLKIGGIVVDVLAEGGTVEYSSTNTNAITAENGVVTAVGNGVSTVKATFTYNNKTYTASKELSTDYYAPATKFTILVPANASTDERTAANKLQDIILEATGVELAIVTESGTETTDGKYLSVGNTVLAKANCDVDDLTKNSASRVKTVDNTVFIRGKTDAATLYGVQRVLKEVVGYEYYLDNTYVVNQTKEFIIADKDYTPQMDEIWQIGGTADRLVAEEHAAAAYTASLIPIGTTDEEDAEGTYRYKGAAHNSVLFFNEGVDDESLFTSYASDTFRKWYATNSSNYYITDKSGIASLTSGAGKMELCYTAHGDSEVRSAMIEKLATEMFRKMTTIEEFKSYNRVAFSHNDIQSWCECSNCNNEGNPSDNMLHFILDVAASLKTKLSNAGDARAETFKICTLFYNETNLFAKNIANYQSAVDNYMQHVEIWFAETRADYHVSLNTGTEWNTTVQSNFEQWTALANTKSADVLWWGYYANTKSAFIPFNSIDALRANYVLAYDAGVDYMFNQMMQYRVNWSRLKQYLASELRWNATPDDNVWDGWIADYMNGAFGPGASAMRGYFNDWVEWHDEGNSDAFENEEGYGGSGISKLLSEVCTTSNMPKERLQGWIESCNKAIAALDVNDDNYTTYYNNIVLERMTPLYLIMHLYGFSYTIATNDNPYEAITSYTLKNSAYVLPYAQDFLDAAALWNINQDGEMSSLDLFKSTLTSQLSGVTNYKEEGKQIVITGTEITLTSANIVSGESYTATLMNSAGEVTATAVTANDGSVTLTFASAPTTGSGNVVLRSSSKVITFNNVLVATGTIANYAQLKAITGNTNSGYYVLTSDITDASGTITLRAGTFSGVLDGNGYTVSNVNVGASGLFRVLNGATIKNVKFDNFNATAPAFGTSATDTTFENVTVSFADGGPDLVTTPTDCTFNNVTVYVTSAGATSTPNGVEVVVGTETGKTFYIPEGETEVWLRDEKLTKGDYTVNVNGEIYNSTVFAGGNLKVAINGLALGESLKVSCDNGTNAYVYNVMRVSKVVVAETGEQLPVYSGDKTALGYYNGDVVQTLTVANGDGSTWDGGIWNNRAKIFAPGTQDYITVDFVAANDFVGTMFQIWPGKGAGSFSKTGVFNDESDPTGATVSIVDEYGFKVNSVAAGKRYTLRVYDPNATGLALSAWGTNTIYFGNVTYGKGTPAEPITPPDVTVGDNRVYSIYKGDETALGFAKGTMVFLLQNATPDSPYGDGWGKRMIFGASTAQDYITFEFVAKEDVEVANIFHVWGVQGAPDIGTVSASTGKGGDWAVILDEYGFAVTSIKAGEHYFASIKCAGLTEVQVGLLDANELYVANVTEHNGDLPTAIQPLVYGLDNSALDVYKGDETALGFAEGTLVFESTAGVNTWNDNAIKFYTDSAANCLVVNFTLSEALAANCNQFMIWTSKVSGGAAAFINNCNTVQNSIDVEIFDADGNVVTVFEANKKYTFKIYHEGSTTVTIALVGDTQEGVTIYYANDYEHTNDEFIPLPENVVTDAAGATLSKYADDATTYGFANTDYVFEATMTDSWEDRVIIPVDSANYDYMDVEFVVTSGPWYFNAWVVNAGGMLDGNYLVAENASNSTFGSGYAPHTPNTGANGGNTKIQVLDANGNVVVGGRTVGTRYVLRVYLGNESLTQVQLGQSNTTILFANVTFGNVESITADGTNASAVSVYGGDVTALGFAAGSRVYEYVGVNEGTDKAVFEVDDTYDYVDVQLVIGSGDGYFLAYALKGGSYLNGGSSYVIDPSWLRLASGAEMDRTIQVFNANGNAVSTLMSTNTLYTLRIYIDGVDQIKIAKAGSTIYLANVTHGNDAAIEKPTEVVTDGDTGTELAQYTGNNADIGFADSDYVFEQVTDGSSWNSRAHVGNNSTADFLVFDFSITNPSNMTVWFTRNGNVIAGYSNIVTNTAYVAANESAARTIYVFGADGSGVSNIVANTKYTMWVYLGGVDSFHGVAIGNGSNATIYYANVRYVNGTGDNILRQSDANSLLPEYTGDETALGFEAGTFVQTLVGTSDEWTEDVYANRARITAPGTQDYISVDFAVAKAFTGSYSFYLWAASGNGSVNKDGTSSKFTTQLVDENGFSAASVEAGKRYTLRVYDPDATYLEIGAYCNNTIYFANVTYGYGELPEPYALLKNSNGALATYSGDVTTLGFAEGEYVQQMVTETTANVWDGTRENLATKLQSEPGKYVSIMFSLSTEFSSGNLFFVWTLSGSSYVDTQYFYIGLGETEHARILGTNGNVITDKLEANTVYMLEIYAAEGVDTYKVGNFVSSGMTVSFATKSVKTYDASIASSPVTGSENNTVTVSYNNANLGFGRNEVVKQLETETVSSVWGDTQPTSGKSRAAWLIKVASEAGKVAKVRFALSQDFNSTGMLFYVWAYSDNNGTCPANGSITLSGSSAMQASITDEAGNAVTSLKAGQVYELSIYCATAIKYDIGNFVAEGMITYVSSTVTYTDAQ